MCVVFCVMGPWASLAKQTQQLLVVTADCMLLALGCQLGFSAAGAVTILERSLTLSGSHDSQRIYHLPISDEVRCARPLSLSIVPIAITN